MESYTLSIQTRRARLDMQGQNTVLSTSMRPASLHLEKRQGSMQIETKHPDVTVDASQALSEENRATNAELLAQFAREGQNAVQEACVRYNRTGQLYRSLPLHPGALRRAALNRAIPAMPQYGLRFVPSAPPHLNVSDNVYSYSYTPTAYDFNWSVHQNAEISVEQPASLSIWMAEEPEIHFSVTA